MTSKLKSKIIITTNCGSLKCSKKGFETDLIIEAVRAWLTEEYNETMFKDERATIIKLLEKLE